MQTIYHYSGGGAPEIQRAYADIIRREFYDGDLDTESRPDLYLTTQKALAHPITLLRTVCNSGITYRRGWDHIRRNKTGVRVIWFVRRGSVQFVRSRKNLVVRAGECAILDSSIPFHAKSSTDGEVFEAVQAIVPAHLFLSHLSMAAELDAPLTLDYANRESAVRLLDMLCDLGSRITAKVAEPLVAAFLETLSERVREITDCRTPRERNSNMRLSDIRAYIMRNLTDPDLNYEDVAAQCGISTRYLYYLLKADNTTFSKLVWSQRLEKAKEWLGSPDLSSHAICEIAFMAGFKDAAHFSRIFKANFGVSPKQYRTEALSRPQEEAAPPRLALPRKTAALLN